MPKYNSDWNNDHCLLSEEDYVYSRNVDRAAEREEKVQAEYERAFYKGRWKGLEPPERHYECTKRTPYPDPGLKVGDTVKCNGFRGSSWFRGMVGKIVDVVVSDRIEFDPKHREYMTSYERGTFPEYQKWVYIVGVERVPFHDGPTTRGFWCLEIDKVE